MSCASIRSPVNEFSISPQAPAGHLAPWPATGAKVTGVDISAELLSAAAERARAENLDIRYDQGDAESLPYSNGEFDAVISTCGVMFASRPEAAARELGRVCRKGGRMAITTWLPDSNLFKMFMVMKPYMAPPPSPPPPSPFEWGKTERVQELLGEAFDLKFEKGTSFYREPSGDAAWNTFSTSYGPTRALAASLDDAKRADLKRDFIAFHEGFRNDLGICVPREYLVTVGIRRLAPRLRPSAIDVEELRPAKCNR